MIQHQAIHNGNGTKLKLALGLATILRQIPIDHDDVVAVSLNRGD